MVGTKTGGEKKVDEGVDTGWREGDQARTNTRLGKGTADATRAAHGSRHAGLCWRRQTALVGTQSPLSDACASRLESRGFNSSCEDQCHKWPPNTQKPTDSSEIGPFPATSGGDLALTGHVHPPLPLNSDASPSAIAHQPARPPETSRPNPFCLRAKARLCNALCTCLEWAKPFIANVQAFDGGSGEHLPPHATAPETAYGLGLLNQDGKRL